MPKIRFLTIEKVKNESYKGVQDGIHAAFNRFVIL